VYDLVLQSEKSLFRLAIFSSFLLLIAYYRKDKTLSNVAFFNISKIIAPEIDVSEIRVTVMLALFCTEYYSSKGDGIL
jgi:hypothetical protein